MSGQPPAITHPNKRKFVSATVSPPPLRRKLQSTTTQNSVASFFTKTSQKPPEKIKWQERAVDDDTPGTLIVGRYEPTGVEPMIAQNKRAKVAAFDLDSTLIETASGKKFASGADDWKWWHPCVPETLKKLYNEDGYRVAVISNQGGISLKVDTKGPKAHQTKILSFKAKVAAVFSQLEIPISIYAATNKDIFRKPRTGIWTELLDDYGISATEVDIKKSIFVGDAGGREAGGGKSKDFSCSDRNFALNVGITYSTPEEFFLKDAPRPFVQSFDPTRYLLSTSQEDENPNNPTFAKTRAQEVVLLCGSPGAGKSTFYNRNLLPLGYSRINQDTLKTRERCLKVASELLREGKSIAVDNTNPDTEVRRKWIELAKKHSAPIRCVLFTADNTICQHNDVVRALNPAMNPEKRTMLPSMAFNSFKSRYEPPKPSEGFEDITEVNFQFVGNEEERKIWSRHWT
ncbi:bifunctional polynucleotide phosphatase/kinase [Calycina marina]|uniref:Bifunctional polynucleotide phosphatase/kinase n=1 Tax=Calycina marina TaxID=1763456 RepID=A0A9P8CFC6_9HELO|nr:bifunctional polynucleotide phosphatase/kinase [Calycina marina]